MKKVYWHVSEHPLEIEQKSFEKMEIVKTVDKDTIFVKVFFRNSYIDYCGIVEYEDSIEYVLYLTKDAAIKKHNEIINNRIAALKDGIKELKKKVL